MLHRLIYDIDKVHYNVIKFNEEGIKSFQDINVVPVLLYFIKLFIFQKFPIAKVSLTFKIQQTMTLY